MFQADMNSEELMISMQNARKHPQHFLIEKSFTIKKHTDKDLPHRPSKKEPGYTITATPHQT